MSRSSWKPPFVENSLFKKFLSQKSKQEIPFPLKVWSRSSTICSDFVGFRFRVHNGKDFFALAVVPEMVGHKFGEFVATRARYEFKKKKKKK